MTTYYSSTDQRCEQSNLEREIFARLQAAGIDLVPQVKLGNNWVFDAAINDTRILVEVHGDYWHTRPEVMERDTRKQVWALQEGYSIITVWEKDYLADPDAKIAEVLRTIEQVRHYMAASGADADALDPLGNKGDTPVAIRGTGYGDWRDRFLEVLGEGGIVREACIAAGISRKTAYLAKQDDPGFADEWKLALQDAADAALAIYRRRAVQQSDRAMEFFLRTRNPEEFGDTARLEMTGANGGPIEVASLTDDERAARIAALLDRARARRAGSAADEESA